MQQYRLNPPPGWPAPPDGWVPPPFWEPDPSWPVPPPGWQLWVPVGAAAAPQVEPAQRSSVRPAGGGDTTGVPQQRRSGLLGRLRRGGPTEVQQLRDWITATQGAEALEVARLLQRTRDEAEQLRVEASREAEAIVSAARQSVKESKAEARRATQETEKARKAAEEHRNELYQAETRLTELRAQIVTTDETAMLQQVGVYSYRHPLQDAVAYRAALGSLSAEIKELARQDRAVLAATDWTVNGSVREGRKMVRDFSKLMLRAYNAEADSAVRGMRPHRLTSLVDRLFKSRETIAKLGATMHIRISDAYHSARVRELELTADFLQRKEEEKEAQREERARQREEAAAQKELDRQREKLTKELGHYQSALDRLRERGDLAAVSELEAKLADLEAALNDVEAQAANVRAGYVYVISNVGAFGDSVVKIGMTRRLEPLDRVYELSGAAVPFRFDVHALIFSKDAVGLETRLHQQFAARRVNRVNARKEFFRVTPTEVRDALARDTGEHVVEFNEVPQALEWRASTGSTQG
ncbi:DUF4041 domain-containing protein [Streptomyces bohaiensis]|uniref:DUF4041 domain-containing protein n=1 Tax=Streptomyces bohaiensis TaxID=1431344 RepID=UPI003B7A9CF7